MGRLRKYASDAERQRACRQRRNWLDIRHGDALTVLRSLPSNSVQTCVTSPPYFGLRDFGTGRWEGGEPTCQHVRSARYSTEKAAVRSTAKKFTHAGPANAERLRKGRWRVGGVCRCGAVDTD
jgi:hypothetical protein